MERLGLALVGCGGMGHRHLNGLIELERNGLNRFTLVGAVDPNRSNAASLAHEAEQAFGVRPAVCAALEELQTQRPDVLAVDMCADPAVHHTIVAECLARGWHVQAEKPIGVSVAACRAIQRAADAASARGLVVSVAENYRRDPLNRLGKALLDAGAIDTPRLLIHQTIGGGDRIVITPWRHLKAHSGVLLDVGVHYADMVEYLLGEVDTVDAQTRLHERVRRPAAGPGNPIYGKLHTLPAECVPDCEDACYALLRYKSGAVGQYTEDHAGHGQSVWRREVFGSRGSISLSGDRSGRPLAVTLDDGETLSDRRVLDLVPDFRLDSATARLFGGERLWRYDLPFSEIDPKITAIEYAEFGRCITERRRPEVPVEAGTRAVALIYAMLESGLAGRPVRVDDVVSGAVDSYQREIDAALGLTADKEG